jgi:N6-L-threonylcarbamoyladenine synthase
MRSGSGLILGIESSCDETAAAVVRMGGQVLANVVASQMTLHAKYGGVVPELASREHLRNIVPVVTAAMAEVGVGFSELDAIAVTEGPGLAGALLVGITYAKALALGLGKPLIAVNHLEGHIHAVLMEAGVAMEMPLLALVVSGGHTHLYVCTQTSESKPGVPGTWRYRNVGRELWTMPRGRRSTRWPSCLGWGIRVGRGWMRWRRVGIRGRWSSDSSSSK